MPGYPERVVGVGGAARVPGAWVCEKHQLDGGLDAVGDWEGVDWVEDVGVCDFEDTAGDQVERGGVGDFGLFDDVADWWWRWF